MLTSLHQKINNPALMRTGVFVRAGLAFLLIGALSGAGGFYAGYIQPEKSSVAVLNTLQQQLLQDRTVLQDKQLRVESELNALALRLGTIQAQMTRLDAVGERLVGMVGLEDDEFVFGDAPKIDDLYLGLNGDSMSATQLLSETDRFAQQLVIQEQQLSLLEDILLSQGVTRNAVPSLLPVRKGWISSNFGSRIHPISGNRRMHQGIDIPGRHGTEILAAAPGVIIKSQYDRGYGNLIEIRHADGYVTKYAHNSKMLAETGQYVQKGEVIALMGSTGISTGTHLHFEVLKNGVPINPRQYIENLN
jgi:murein DD-endopeptidase MepM/ murein hydrolase activator NlpD